MDDILLIAESSEIERVGKAFETEYRWITMAVGNSHSYVGMGLMVEPGCVVLDMRYYLTNLLQPYDNLQVKAVPGNKGTFTVRDELEKLDLKKRTLFHSTVAKLLYLSKKGTTGHYCGSRFSMHKGEGSNTRRLEETGKSPRISQGDEGFRHEA